MSATNYPRRALVRHTAAALQLRHPELRGEISREALLAVCERDDIDMTFHRIAGGNLGCAIALPFGSRTGRFDDAVRMIWVAPDLDPAVELFVIAHEIGHQHLHLTPDYLEAWRPDARPMAVRRQDSEHHQREAEADYFADLIVGPALAALAHQQIEAIRRAA